MREDNQSRPSHLRWGAGRRRGAKTFEILTPKKFQLNIIFQLMALFNNLGKEEEPVVEEIFFNQVSLFQRGRSDSKVECITFFLCNVHSWGWSNYELIWGWRWWWQGEEGERGCQQWYGNYHSRPNIRECLPKALQSFTLTIVRLIVIAFARGFDSPNHVSHSKQFFNELFSHFFPLSKSV